MKKTILVLTLWSVLFQLVGCDAKEIQSQTYITGLGIDYADDEFIVYTQAQNFANIAKQEGTTSLQQSAPMLIGEAKGKSIHSALDLLEQNSALPFYYGHVNTILLSENVIKEKMNSVIDFIGQNPFLRYNIWLMGTQENIKDIFLGESFFNFPSTYTILHSPNLLTKNTIIIPIEEYNKFVSAFFQPIGSFIIPSIALNDTNFFKGDEQKNISTLTGGFAISQQQFKGWVDKEDLVGVKWASKNVTNIPYSLFQEKVSLLIQKPKFRIEVISGPKPSYNLILKMDAQIDQNQENISYDRIEKELEKEIKEELMKTIEKSEELKTDLLNISETTYRYHLKEWNLKNIPSISKDSINKIEVNLNIINTLHYKR
ncbi:Ger(x)C family spore germination protein [Mesobacillus maritimus]|uniref:Ger(X)C family spore germination protein n=1 Tax=Mesobacillus maritimus TaxID=1643336 RepID=A0ABS7K8K7_9BACI|nr:Ger(x)C family spore germination protein [Mesobacillus maritimus]MBY0098560.1 Ger(x)C family spore germination protein [Mesobacillus maritimus]